MTRWRSHPTVSAHTHAARSRVLLLALVAMGCSDVTGPRTAPEDPPADEMRVASLTITDSAHGATSLHRFLYDEAGRLKRVNYYFNQVPGGPPERLMHYAEHTYTGDVLTQTNHFGRRWGGDDLVHRKRIDYGYDLLGYRVRERVYVRLENDVGGASADSTFVTRFRYNRRGRLAERVEESGDRIIYGYGDDGLLALVEYRFHDGSPPVRQTLSYAGGRNPFYLRLAHVNSLHVPVPLESILLAAANPALQETRTNSDPEPFASVTHEYRFDGAGRPLHIRETLHNVFLGESTTAVLLYDFEYEPAGG